MIKKVLIFLSVLVLLVCAFTFNINTKVKADVTSSELTVSGASVRTTGNAGIKFDANVGDYDKSSIKEYGIVIAFGEANTNDITIGNTVNGKLTLNKTVNELDEHSEYHIVLYGVPETSYTQLVSARAYIVLNNDSIIYGTQSITRDLWTVSAKAQSDGVSGDILDDIVTYVSNNYMVKTITLTNQFVISNVNYKYYHYSDSDTLNTMLANLWSDFITDYNNATGESLTTSSTITEFHTSMSSGIANNNVLTIPSDANSVKFFSGVNLVKWGWILEFFTEYGTVHVKNQAEALLRDNRTCQKYYSGNRLPSHKLRHLDGAIWNLFHRSYNKIDGMDNYDCTNYSTYSNITFPDVTNCNDSNTIRVGSKVLIPNPINPGYTLNSFQKLGGSTYNVNDEYDVTTTPAVFTPDYDAIEYTIHYDLDGGQSGNGTINTYTVENETFNLVDPIKEGYSFMGWYNNPSYTGNRITKINLGTTGDINLYAKYIREVSVVNKAWENLTNGTKVDYNSEEYTIGTNAFASIADALNAASEYEQIYILPDTYNETLDITKNGISLIGPKDGIDAVNGSRGTGEAIITNVITIASGVNNTTITGFKFTGNGQIAGTSSNSDTNINNHEGINFLYNYVDKGDNTTPVIKLINGNRTYEKDVRIDYCYFTAPSLAQVETDKYGLVYIYDSLNLTIKHSKFYNIPSNAVGIYDPSIGKGLGGDLIVEDNEFNTIGVSAIWVNYHGPLSGTNNVISVKNNYFKNVNYNKVVNKAAINFEEGNTDATYASFIIEKNIFEHTFYCLWTYKSSGIIFTNNVIYKYALNTKTRVAKGTSGYSINCASNLYLTHRGVPVTASVYSTNGSTGFEFNSNASNVDESNYTTVSEYNSATGKGFVNWTVNQRINYSKEDLDAYFASITEVKNDLSLPLTNTVFGTNISWSSSNTLVLTDDGHYLMPNIDTIVTLTATINYDETYDSYEYNVTVKDSGLLELLTSGNRNVVNCNTINYIGWESGYESVPHKVYTSVNDYYAGSIPALTLNLSNDQNTSGTMTSIEYIVIHDTGSAANTSTALANSNWCKNANNTSTSWHYTIGNDGIYKQLEDNKIAWHAGDGTGWSGSNNFYDTGIVADSNLRNRARVTLGNDGYFYVNGTKTTIPLPDGATSNTGTNDLGITAIVKNGNYYLPPTWVTTGYGNVVAIRGGGMHGIGIETAVNTGSDVYLTWQYTAKFVATLLIKHKLTPERVLFHNSFSNKTCPNTMINANMVETFLDMVYMEYYIAKNYNGFTIIFTSNNPSVIDNSGRVVGNGPNVDTLVSYTITITKTGKTKSATLESLVKANN